MSKFAVIAAATATIAVGSAAAADVAWFKTDTKSFGVDATATLKDATAAFASSSVCALYSSGTKVAYMGMVTGGAVAGMWVDGTVTNPALESGAATIGGMSNLHADSTYVFAWAKPVGVAQGIQGVKLADSTVLLNVGGGADAAGATATAAKVTDAIPALALNAANDKLYFGSVNYIRSLAVDNAVAGAQVVAVLAGATTTSASTDATGAAARFTDIMSMVIVKTIAAEPTAEEFLLVGEKGADAAAYKIRKVVTADGVTTTVFTGSATEAVSGYSGAAGKLSIPMGMAAGATNEQVYVVGKGATKWTVSTLEFKKTNLDGTYYLTVQNAAEFIPTGVTNSLFVCGAAADGVVYVDSSTRLFKTRNLKVDNAWFTTADVPVFPKTALVAEDETVYTEVHGCTYDAATAGKELMFFAKTSATKFELVTPVGDNIEVKSVGAISNVAATFAFAYYGDNEATSVKAIRRIKMADGTAALSVGPKPAAGPVAAGKGDKIDMDVAPDVMAVNHDGTALYFADTFRIRSAKDATALVTVLDVAAFAGTGTTGTTNGATPTFGAVKGMVVVKAIAFSATTVDVPEHLLVADVDIRKVMTSNGWTSTVFTAGAGAEVTDGYSGLAAAPGTMKGPMYLAASKAGEIFVMSKGTAKWSVSLLSWKHDKTASTPYHIKSLNSDAIAFATMPMLCGMHADKGLVYGDSTEKKYFWLADVITTTTTTTVNTTDNETTAAATTATTTAAGNGSTTASNSSTTTTTTATPSTASAAPLAVAAAAIALMAL